MNDEMISVIEAGRQLGRPKTTSFKVMGRLGIHAQKRRDSDRGNQLVAYISGEEFVRVKEALIAGRSERSEEGESDTEDAFISAEIGVFYLIQLEPDHDPFRFKVGFAANVTDRLRALLLRPILHGCQELALPTPLGKDSD